MYTGANPASCESDDLWYWVMPTSVHSCKIHNNIIIYFSESPKQIHYQRMGTNQNFLSQFEFHHSGSMLAWLFFIQKIVWNTNSFWKWWCHGWMAPVSHFSFPCHSFHLNSHCKLNLQIKAKNIFKYTFSRVYWLIDRLQGNRLFIFSYSQESMDQEGEKSAFHLNTIKPLSVCQLEITSFLSGKKNWSKTAENNP